MDSFDAYARYYDLIYRDKDYAAEAQYVHNLIQRCAPGARSILELGCGTGAHAEEFAEEFARLGYEVHGVDASEEMLERAHARQILQAPEVAKRLVFSAGDVRSFRTGHQFDAVTALFHVISYQIGDDDLLSTFATARRNPIGANGNANDAFRQECGRGGISSACDRPAQCANGDHP
jgi:predicted TPR repeat methyltransferase